MHSNYGNEKASVRITHWLAFDAVVGQEDKYVTTPATAQAL